MNLTVELYSFILILIRVSAMLFTIPIIGARNIPISFKMGLGFFISLILIHVVKIDVSVLSKDLYSLGLAIGGEILIGVIIGLIAKLIFTTVDMAGEIMGFQMGFSIVNVIDPQTSTQVPIIGQFQTILSTLIFLSMNAHHYFLKAIVDSFTLVPPLHLTLSERLLNTIMRLAGDMFVIAIRIGAPVIVALLITNIAMGIISKTIPQMNILVVGFPLTVFGGLIVMSLSLPLFLYLMQKIFEAMNGNIFNVLSLMGR